MIEIVEANIGHINKLKNNLRKDDVLEIERAGGNAKMALVLGYKRSSFCKVAIVDGQVAAAWGVIAAPLSLTGNIWFLTAPACEKVSPILFARIYKRQVQEMLKLVPRLENFVDTSYKKSVRMLELAGFSLGETVNIGDAMFVKFSIGER